MNEKVNVYGGNVTSPFDGLLFVLMFSMIGILVYEFIRLIREDPDYWLIARNNRSFMKIWNFLERVQPKKNTSILKSKSESN
ncbi:hypothetical protein A3K69_02590 [Candidatus Bathyarchaeota archaeon RBG_16_57_9]|nr:MAG: hypothetical protein A3K69_02590 [Candidatus Bathyarchaeota archaeon RBG_16_57_9]